MGNTALFCGLLPSSYYDVQQLTSERGNLLEKLVREVVLNCEDMNA